MSQLHGRCAIASWMLLLAWASCWWNKCCFTTRHLNTTQYGRLSEWLYMMPWPCPCGILERLWKEPVSELGIWIKCGTFWEGVGGLVQELQNFGKVCASKCVATLWASLCACSIINFCCVLSNSRCNSIFSAFRVSCDDLSWCFTECTSARSESTMASRAHCIKGEEG